MPCKCPCDPAIFQLLGTDLASVGTIGLVENVLSGDFDLFAEVFAGEEEVQSRWGDDDF